MKIVVKADIIYNMYVDLFLFFCQAQTKAVLVRLIFFKLANKTGIKCHNILNQELPCSN